MRQTINLLLLLFIPVSLFMACNEQKVHKAEFTAEENRAFKTPENRNLPYTSQYLQTDSGEYLACFFKTPEIIFYDFNNGDSVKSIPIKKHYRSLRSFYVHTPDSVFLFFNAGYRPNYNHDSTLIMINRQGEIKDSYSFDGAPVKQANAKQIDHPDVLPIEAGKIKYPKNILIYTGYGFDKLLYQNKKLFVKFNSCCNPRYDSILDEHFVPAGGHIQIEENKFYAHGVRLPSFKAGTKTYSDDYKAFGNMALDQNGNPVYAYQHTPNLFRYILDDNTVERHVMRSVLIDTIKPVEKPNENQKFVEGSYSQFYYNKYDGNYYRSFYLPIQQDLPPALKNIRRSGIIISDSTFTKLGEGLMPQTHVATQAIFTPEGVWFIKKDAANDSLIYTRFSFEFKKMSKEDFIRSVRKFDYDDVPVAQEDIEQYAKEFLDPQTDKFGMVLVPASSCPICVLWVLDYYKENESLFVERGVHLILAGNKSIQNQYLMQTQIDTSSSNLHFDTEEIHLNYIEKFINPRFSFFKEGELTFDTIYNPTSLYDFPYDLKHESQ
jgi:hypothetical protein